MKCMFEPCENEARVYYCSRECKDKAAHYRKKAYRDINEQQEVPPRTRRCRNKECINRFVPVSVNNWFCSDCRGRNHTEMSLFSLEEILGEEASLEPNTHPLTMARVMAGQKNATVRRLDGIANLHDYVAIVVSDYLESQPYLLLDRVELIDNTGPGSRGEMELILSLGDWQLGKIDQGLGMKELVERRVPRIIDATAQIAREWRDAGYRIRRINLDCLGDMVEGCGNIYKGQSLNLDRTGRTQMIIEQTMLTGHLTACVAVELAKHFEEVAVHIIAGNHGRTDTRTHFTDPRDNFDILAGQMAKAYAQNEPRVKWDIFTDDFFGVYRTRFGQTVYLEHGDAFRGSSGEAFGSILPQRVASGLIPEFPDLAYLGHRHDFLVFRIGTRTTCIQNGTIDGGSHWYLKATGKASRPSQTLTCVTEKYVPRDIQPIEFEAPIHIVEEPRWAEILPPRFQMNWLGELAGMNG